MSVKRGEAKLESQEATARTGWYGESYTAWIPVSRG